MEKRLQLEAEAKRVREGMQKVLGSTNDMIRRKENRMRAIETIENEIAQLTMSKVRLQNWITLVLYFP